ncbi:hypothetical protein F2Q69_00007033 [Brassica cretica]|uniref:Uncharacterized protein n=1 Tax=Brassica cretica TaxID=69181 RepID=A0A8S9PBF9_BRACR|nr:hypothetical protein F2Q69_00007033 [Brassica cretica]
MDRGLSISEKDNKWKLPLQDYLNPGRTYSNRSAIRLPKDDTKKSGISLEYLIMQIDFVDSQTSKNKYPNPDSFTQKYDATVGSRRGRAKFRLNQAFTGNRKLATDLNGKIDLIFSDMMRKFNTLSEHIKRLDKINNAEKHVVVQEAGENRSRPIILDDPNTESEIPRKRERPNTEKEAIDLEEEEGELGEDVEIDRQERKNVDRQTTMNIGRHSGNNVDRLSTPAEPAIERLSRTLLPFPPNKTQSKRELDKAICKKAFDKITLEMPLSDAIKVSPSIKKICKRYGIQQFYSR